MAYLLHTFGNDVFGGSITLIETELTLAEHSPAMAHVRGKAAELRTQRHALAEETGTALAKLVAQLPQLGSERLSLHPHA